MVNEGGGFKPFFLVVIVDKFQIGYCHSDIFDGNIKYFFFFTSIVGDEGFES